MALLERNIPGVGMNSNQQPPSNAAATAHLANQDRSVSPSTDKQRAAIRILERALKDALFVSEGEEPFQTVHIVPKHSITEGTSTAALADNTTLEPLPTNVEFIQILQEAQLIPADDDNNNHRGDTDVTPKIVCERTTDLSSVLNESNTGRDNIGKALHDVFGYDATSTPNSNVALYRVTLPSSATRIHFWVLGWVDRHLVGLHTLSIES